MCKYRVKYDSKKFSGAKINIKVKELNNADVNLIKIDGEFTQTNVLTNNLLNGDEVILSGLKEDTEIWVMFMPTKLRAGQIKIEARISKSGVLKDYNPDPIMIVTHSETFVEQPKPVDPIIIYVPFEVIRNVTVPEPAVN